MPDYPSFQPARWLKNRHLQTLWPTLCRRKVVLSMVRERLELPDGDFTDVDWLPGHTPDGPTVIMLHGLEGSAQSPYVQGLMRVFQTLGWQAALLHFRGCSGEPNRLAMSYHAGFTGDLDYLIRRLKQVRPQREIAVVGFSLGGNVLLNWLAYHDSAHKVSAAVAVSVPYDLSQAADTLESGASRLYNAHLLRSLRRSVMQKRRVCRSSLLEINLNAIKTLRQFDERITAPLNGFLNADDYYRRCSARSKLAAIQQTPLLLIHAQDDPITGAKAIPPPNELGARTRLEVSAHGGHVGFVGCRGLGKMDYWLERRIPAYLQSQLIRT